VEEKNIRRPMGRKKHTKVEDRGIELPQDSSGNTPLSETGGAESGAVGAQSGAAAQD
jgi:hypothetical protein